jgi:autoinducer 2-degrading protein
MRPLPWSQMGNESAHYQTRRDTVAEMIAEPRSSVKYANILPDDEGWG